MMKSLLPPNSTNFEKILENATRFSVNSSILKGFKFQNNPKILSHLVWEYSLNDVLSYIEGTDIISDGLVFQRTKGTKAAIIVSANWASLADIDIYEEEPSEHFYEFQIGVKDRQFDFDAELLQNVINLAKPVRSRLSRVYNDIYDVRYFKLDGSQFGDFLSDNSGIKLHDLTLSFGRKTVQSVNYDLILIKHGTVRTHSTKSSADLIYRLDFAILGDEEPDINAIEFERRRIQAYQNDDSLCETAFSFEKYLTFAKASIVLSEASKLGETNTCFAPLTEIEENQTFELGIDSLSDHLWNFKTEAILERFEGETKIHCKTKILPNLSANSRVRSSISTVYENSKAQTEILRNIGSSTKPYETNPYWSDHKHPAKPWNDELQIGTISEI